MTSSVTLTSGLIDSISQTSWLIEKSNRSDKETMIKVMEQAARFLSQDNLSPEQLNELAAAVKDIRVLLNSNQDVSALISGVNVLTSDIFSSLVEIVPEESGGFCSRRCVLKFGNGEFFYSANKRLTSDDFQYNMKGYPSQARFASEYFDKIDRYSGLVEKKPSSPLSYYMSSTTLNTPGTVVINGVDKNSSIRCRSQVEVDLGRFNTVTIAKELMYSDLDKLGQKEKAAMIMIKLRNTLKDDRMTQSVSQLMTQATIAGASVDFFLRFSNQRLQCGFNSPASTDVVVRNHEKDVEVSFYALYHIRDLTRLYELEKVELLSVFRSCVVQRKIVIGKESLKKGSSKGGRMHDSYSKFFGISEDAEEYRLKQLSI